LDVLGPSVAFGSFLASLVGLKFLMAFDFVEDGPSSLQQASLHVHSVIMDIDWLDRVSKCMFCLFGFSLTKSKEVLRTIQTRPRDVTSIKMALLTIIVQPV
jgi:hypothetical protein